MKQNIELNSTEKKEQTILRVLLFLTAVIVFKGIYNQRININQDNILYPLFLSIAGLFCLIYSINAFTTGNLVRSWASTPIFNELFNLIKSKSSKTDEEAILLTTKLFGTLTILIAILLFSLEIDWFMTM